ncbi:hypothetical protein [Synechococcus sp. RSCCF101]|uniref:hypothetical protein n=1 Tax=Synechococcus sp. RSCCF101 TaxID=2511069 RepID=UPI001CD92BBD|nr:hypothetical protein [Synechococcus sp. RSCCF101]
MDLQGRPSVALQDLDQGRRVPLPLLRRHRPHSSPSLSWNGRYLALITQQGRGRLALVHDRRTRRLHPLRLPPAHEPVSLSLAPDAGSVALQTLHRGRFSVLLLDLSTLLEPDRPPGSRLGLPEGTAGTSP